MAHHEPSLTTAQSSAGLLDDRVLGPSSTSALVPVTSVAVAPVLPAKKPVVRRRIKAPRDSKVYKVALAYIALKAQGVKLAEIAETLHLTKNTVATYIKRANRKGWLNFDSFEDPDDQLEIVLKSKAVRNINTILDETTELDGSPTARAGDAAFEVAKGTGLLKQHQVVKSDNVAAIGVSLKVQVEMPSGANTPIVRAGSIGGQPAFDAEVIEGES